MLKFRTAPLLHQIQDGAAMGTGAGPQVPQVEARSLSDLNILAANPPQYPHHPEVRESLTLYISRVPGTRGVYLDQFFEIDPRR